MRIYMAGPLFTTAEFEFNKMLAFELRTMGHDVFLPQEGEQETRDADGKLNTALIFTADVRGIDWSQLVLANIDGADSDSGTSWELGYGYAKGKHTMVYRTDIRVGKDDIVNLMLTESANVVILAPLMGVRELAWKIHNEIAARFV